VGDSEAADLPVRLVPINNLDGEYLARIRFHLELQESPLKTKRRADFVNQYGPNDGAVWFLFTQQEVRSLILTVPQLESSREELDFD
jgi:hypothetical protein